MEDLTQSTRFCCVTAPVTVDENGEPISSSRVRTALASGRPELAAHLLGRRWSIDYRVEAGDRRGRELGFATANGTLGRLMRPAYGIYAVFAYLEDGRRLPGVANIGIRPMWETSEPLVETHIFDFCEDIYGQNLRVEVEKYLRPEIKFTSVETLISQINLDCMQARAILDSNG